MTKDNNDRAPGEDATQNTSDSLHHSEVDALIVWFNLGKRSRDRQKKRDLQMGTWR